MMYYIPASVCILFLAFWIRRIESRLSALEKDYAVARGMSDVVFGDYEADSVPLARLPAQTPGQGEVVNRAKEVFDEEGRPFIPPPIKPPEEIPDAQTHD